MGTPNSIRAADVMDSKWFLQQYKIVKDKLAWAKRLEDDAPLNPREAAAELESIKATWQEFIWTAASVRCRCSPLQIALWHILIVLGIFPTWNALRMRGIPTQGKEKSRECLRKSLLVDVDACQDSICYLENVNLHGNPEEFETLRPEDQDVVLYAVDYNQVFRHLLQWIKEDLVEFKFAYAEEKLSETARLLVQSTVARAQREKEAKKFNFYTFMLERGYVNEASYFNNTSIPPLPVDSPDTK